MPKEFARKHRVAEEIKRELGVLITTEVKDPRVRLITITEVSVSSDLKYAKVYVGSFDLSAATDSAAEALEGLRAARGFLKRALGKRLHLRTIPDLRFYEDTTEREAQRLTQLINSAVAEDERHAHDGDASDDDGPA